MSLHVCSHRSQLFPQKSLNTSCAAVRQQGCEASRVTETNFFRMRSSGFLPTGPAGERRAADQYTNTLCSRGKQSVLSVRVKKEQVKSDNIVDHESMG